MRIAAPTPPEPQGLVERIGTRLGRPLERRGILVRSVDDGYLDLKPESEEDALTPHDTWRICRISRDAFPGNFRRVRRRRGGVQTGRGSGSEWHRHPPRNPLEAGGPMKRAVRERTASIASRRLMSCRVAEIGVISVDMRGGTRDRRIQRLANALRLVGAIDLRHHRP